MLSVDLAELNLDRVDKEITTQLKSDEELARLTVDPHLTESAGQDVDISVLVHLTSSTHIPAMKLFLSAILIGALL
ncbi:serine/threonine-protein phosphatase 4 regulatory subunit 4-like isoform X6 [Biomphalaria pfeifferi]|uniref:Serine/threonine-protein phosphatase 4 regulatory subunit 4-like isoform X6 n=1 Tax=Biomphalaria pfeifferi TaxID=112525 RepID=A0AAD8B3R0_BIOPF|nr:serine/threonine-protein phosphatase 4 regulatory subunit 4-like isoform X6 [Biomphalaria pfeifferi]